MTDGSRLRILTLNESFDLHLVKTRIDSHFDAGGKDDVHGVFGSDFWFFGDDRLLAQYLNRHEARFVGVVFHFFLAGFLSPVIEPVLGESVVSRKIAHRQTAFFPG